MAPNTFIELKNVGTTPLQIGGWYIMTGLKVTQRIATIPDGTTLPAGCTFLITSTSSGDLPVPHTLGWREGAGIVDPTGRIRDSVAIDRDDDEGAEYPLVEGTRIFGIPSGLFDRSVARVADADTNNNAADFIVLTSPTPQSSAACAPAGAPAPPTQLAATVNGASVMLNWAAPASGELTHYILEAGTAPGATNVGAFHLPPHLNGLLIPVVADGRYYVRLRAASAQALSNASNEVEVVVCWNSCTVPPGDTTQLAFQVSGNSVLLSWTPPGSGGPISTYVVEAGSASGLADLAVFATGSTARFAIVNGVPPGVYFVRVRAFGPGGLGGVSNQIVVVIP